MNRRRLLGGLIGATALGGAGRGIFAQDDDLARVEAVEGRARGAGIENLGVVKGTLYLGVGNADTAFATTALRLLDALAKDFLKHFQDRGFAVEKPSKKLLVVILDDPANLASFLGENPGSDVRGIYDVDAGWLAMCDNRGGAGGPRAERANSITLFHEGTHQLCFECGLLKRLADIPLCISEGLATYGETRRPDGKTPIGARNQERIAVLRGRFDRANKLREPLLSVKDLIETDDLLDGQATEQLAYAQSWALIHMLMQTDEDQVKLRAYLDAIRQRTEASQRVADVEAHLGKIDELDARLGKAIAKLVKR